MKRCVVLGAGGFIGSHMVKRLKSENYTTIGVDLKYPEYSESLADKFYKGDLTVNDFVKNIFNEISFFKKRTKETTGLN